MHELVATCLGVGRFPYAPGTAASFLAVVVGVGLQFAGGFWLLSIVVVGVLASGFWAVALYPIEEISADPPEIVIDEVAGQLIALLPVPILASSFGTDPLRAVLAGALVQFALFRVLDIWKPLFIGWADKLGGPHGVMLDDLLAGAAAAVIFVFLAVLIQSVSQS